MNGVVRALVSLAIEVATIVFMIRAGVGHYLIPIAIWRCALWLHISVVMFTVMKRRPDLMPNGDPSETIDRAKKLADAVHEEMG